MWLCMCVRTCVLVGQLRCCSVSCSSQCCSDSYTRSCVTVKEDFHDFSQMVLVPCFEKKENKSVLKYLTSPDSRYYFSWSIKVISTHTGAVLLIGFPLGYIS